MHLTWLIQGHLRKEDALNMVDVAEQSLDYKRISKDEINYTRLVKLNDRTIYNFEKSNENAENPNSCCECIFTHTFDVDKDEYAVSRVLADFLSEPTFTTLRT